MMTLAVWEEATLARKPCQLTRTGVGVEKERQQNVFFSYECRCQVFLLFG